MKRATFLVALLLCAAAASAADFQERELTRLGIELSRLAEPDRRSHERRMAELQVQMRPLENEMQLLWREEQRTGRREERLVAIAEAKLKEIVDRAIRRGMAEKLR